MNRKLSATLITMAISTSALTARSNEAGDGSWSANPGVVATAARPGLNFQESKVGQYTLPDPLVDSSGVPVRRDTWPVRRAEILELFQDQMYGRPVAKPPKSLSFRTIEDDPRALDGRATRKLVEIGFDTPHAGRFRFQTQLFTPNGTTRPAPAIVLLAFKGLDDPIVPQVIDRGFAIAVLDRTQIADDDADTYRDKLINAFKGDRPLDAADGRAIAAWAWAASRVLDFLLTIPTIDANRIGVAGHSRMGKTALWAAASDPRFAVAFSNNSGCGGAALSRRNLGETVRVINTAFPHWFCQNFQQYNDRESALPVDQHMLISLIAPRLVYVTSADEDLWADPRGEFLSCLNASPVYELLGANGLGARVPATAVERAKLPAVLMPPLNRPLTQGRIGYHIRTGGHALTDYDWQRFLDFVVRADRHSRAGGNPPAGGTDFRPQQRHDGRGNATAECRCGESRARQ